MSKLELKPIIISLIKKMKETEERELSSENKVKIKFHGGKINISIIKRDYSVLIDLLCRNCAYCYKIYTIFSLDCYYKIQTFL